MVEKSNYQLYGYLNMYDVMPDFVYPVYSRDGELYFADGGRSKIEQFVPVQEAFKQYVRVLKKDVSCQVSCGDETIYIFQKGDGSVLVGTGMVLRPELHRLKAEIANDEILMKSVRNFLKFFDMKAYLDGISKVNTTEKISAQVLVNTVGRRTTGVRGMRVAAHACKKRSGAIRYLKKRTGKAARVRHSVDKQ